MKNFLTKAKLFHGDKYDYSLVEYQKADIKVKIICKKHGQFEQIPSNHIRGKGCKQCTIITTEDFINKSKLVHDDIYNYSLVNYINSKIKVKIICKIHGEFEQIPNNHIIGQGCAKCGRISQSKINTKTNENFIKEIKELHGDIYDYSLVEYVKINCKIKILCKIHGEFEQTPGAHLQGQGCPKCGTDKRRISQENIIERSIDVHGDKYDYSLVKYKDTTTKIKIICKIHGEFEQLPLHHIVAKQGCKKCTVDKLRSSTNEFIEKAKNMHNKYDYSLVKYIDNITKIKIICSEHGEFEQRPSDHLDGRGCSKCSTDNQRSSREEFIEKSIILYGNKYDYSLVDYITNKIKVKIICKIHGIFEQTPNCHLNNHCCPQCIFKTEGKIKDFLIKNNIKFETQCIVDNKRFDFLIDEDYILEIDGRQHFPHLEKQDSIITTNRNDIFKNDVQKMESIIDYYPIVRLFQEHVWDNKYDWEDLILNKTKNLEPEILYIRSDEKDIYKYHTLNFKSKFI
jgi:very-short-patch-repair endonuclease